MKLYFIVVALVAALTGRNWIVQDPIWAQSYLGWSFVLAKNINTTRAGRAGGAFSSTKVGDGVESEAGYTTITLEDNKTFAKHTRG